MSSKLFFRFGPNVVALALLGCALPACTGGQTGGQVRTGAGEDNFGCSEGETTTLTEDAVSPLGFSAKDVLAFTATTHTSPLSWRAESPGSPTVEVTPAAGESEIEITVRYQGGAIRHLERNPRESANGEEPAIQILPGPGEACPDLLTIEVEVEITTENGAFSDTFTGQLTASSTDRADLNILFTLEQLDGAFAVQVLEPEDAEAKQFHLSVSFTPEGFSGHIQGVIEQQRGDTVGATWIRYAEWGSDED